MAVDNDQNPNQAETEEEPDRYVPSERYKQLMDVLKHRRATRGYQAQPVEEEKIEKVLEAGRWAPSGANAQPWEFIVVTDEDLIWEIGDTYVESYDGKYRESAPDFPVDNKRWQREVPCYIIVLGDRRIRQAYPSADMPREQRANVQTYQHSLGDAIYAMWLAATTLGLSMTEATCYSDHAERIREILDIPEVYDVIASLPLGYPLRYQKTRFRRPLKEFVHREEYDYSKFQKEEELQGWLDQVKRSRYRGDGDLIPKEQLKHAKELRKSSE